MGAALVAIQGPLTGERFPIDTQPLTIGRSRENAVVLSGLLASRFHAEVRHEANSYVLYDRGSRNGTWVNGKLVTVHALQPNEQIAIDEETFRLELEEAQTLVRPAPVLTGDAAVPLAPSSVLRVTVAGGGPVGLAFSLLLEQMLGPRVAIQVYDSRWVLEGDRIVWGSLEQGNMRRQQVVTLQSRQYTKLPAEVQEHLFRPGTYSEMWPEGPDSVDGLPPRNVRIADFEDQLLEVANGKKGHLRLTPEAFDAESAREEIVGQHVLAICEGSRSPTRERYADKFGVGDPGLYGLEGKQVSDMVLGLRVKSSLPDPMAVLLTVSQNRFLLNSLCGEGYLNMRLIEAEEKEVVGIDPVRQVFTNCIQAQPCLLERTAAGQFQCSIHQSFFLPALLGSSAFWARVQEGLRLFGVPAEDLSGVTGFRLDMVQRPRFTAQLYPRTSTTTGTFACLLGDAANAIHFWPGRGLNSGLASAISLSRCLATHWHGTPLREADFVRHEGVMAMLQYRHKSRAWRQMVTLDGVGNDRAIRDLIGEGIAESERGAYDQEADLRALLERMGGIRARLEPRREGLPDDATLLAHLKKLAPQTVHTLLVSGAWDTATVGGEEVDVDWLFAGQDAGNEIPALAEQQAAPTRVIRGGSWRAPFRQAPG